MFAYLSRKSLTCNSLAVLSEHENEAIPAQGRGRRRGWRADDAKQPGEFGNLLSLGFPTRLLFFDTSILPQVLQNATLIIPPPFADGSGSRE